MAAAPRSLRLLSLDGGGVRGMSSLFLLKQLMETVDEDGDETPKGAYPLGQHDPLLMVDAVLTTAHRNVSTC